MARNIQAAKRLESRDIPLLLVGESGTGKEFFARALHSASERADKPFVAVNCGSLPEIADAERAVRPRRASARPRRTSAAESYRPTAACSSWMTSATCRSSCKRSSCTCSRSARCCRAARKRPSKSTCGWSVRPRGGLQEKIRRGEFREDLFYRLQGLVLALPPLRERRDKPALIRHIFSQEVAATPAVSLSEDLIEALCAYSWPGNIRQLRNVLRGMIAMRTSDRLDSGNLPADYGIGQPVAETEIAAEASTEAQSLNPLEKAERAALLREIDLHHGNISRVAQKLGIGRNTLYRKMRRLGIAFPARQSARR